MDSETFRQQIIPLGRPMYGAAFAMLGDREEAADAVQDVMERLWSMRDSLDGIGSLAGYCMSVLRHEAISRLRRRKHMAEISEIPEPSVPPDESDESSVIIDRIIATLPVNQQAVVKMNAFEGLSNEEIANIMDITPENMRQLLSRARRKIRELYQRMM